MGKWDQGHAHNFADYNAGRSSTSEAILRRRSFHYSRRPERHISRARNVPELAAGACNFVVVTLEVHLC